MRSPPASARCCRCLYRWRFATRAAIRLPGVTVTYTASPGATLSAASVLTDANGLASATLRLPSSVGIAVVTAQALGQYVTFGARAVSTPALSVPKMTATSQNLLGSRARADRPEGNAC